jgi:hypothetical protein
LPRVDYSKKGRTIAINTATAAAPSKIAIAMLISKIINTSLVDDGLNIHYCVHLSNLFALKFFIGHQINLYKDISILASSNA